MFTEKRAQLVEAFNQQHRVYLEQKAEVDAKRSKQSAAGKDGEESEERAHLQLVQFCMALVRLHFQLLRLCQINCSLQQLVTGILDSSEVSLRLAAALGPEQ